MKKQVKKKNRKRYIHELFNPTIETASDIIKRITKEFPSLRFEQVIYINNYEAICIFYFFN